MTEERDKLLEHTPATEFEPGDVIDGYVLERKLGEGSFGVVFLARQEQPVPRQVALKVLKLGMDSRAILARFEVERRVLARMEHPNIARILDAGSTTSGRPYFVMEPFPGEPITTFARDRRLSVRARLELFVQACEAVQHAHNKGVIHRDLKPSNVLVRTVDDRQVVKVIDFGVAKAIDRPLLEGSLVTRAGGVLGTPAYMSPEQADGGLDVDIRCDVYLLGTLLYELLAGSAPFDVDSMAFDELLRRIREVDPPRPSTVLRKASRRSPEIPTDLDLIVLRCLEKDRERRYPTAIGLAADVGRFLEGRPVEAVPPSALYRLGKLARRHRIAFVSALLVSASMMAGVAGLSAGLVATSAARKELALAYAEAQADAERARRAEETAREQRQVAEEVVEFLTHDVLSNVAPSLEPGHGRDVTLREVLDEAASKIDGSGPAPVLFDRAPEVRARINATIGASYEALGLLPAAVEHLSAALEYFETRHGLRHRDTLTLASQLANLHGGLGQVAQADALFARIVDRPDALLESADDHAFTTLRRLAMLRLQQGDQREASRIIEATLARARETRGESSDSYLVIGTSAAIVRDTLGDSRGAGTLFREVYETRLQLEGTLGHAALGAGVNYASFLYKRGRLDEARELLEQVLGSMRELLGPHPQTVAAISNLGLVLADLGQLDAALDLLTEARDLNATLLGEDHPETLRSEGRLAGLAWTRGDREEAIAMQGELVRRAETALGRDAPATLSHRAAWLASRVSLAPDAAHEAELLDLLADQQALLGSDSPPTLLTRSHLAAYYNAFGDLPRAESFYLDVLERHERLFGPDGPQALRAGSDLAVFYRETGRIDEALELVRSAVERGRATFGPDSVLQTYLELELGRTLAMSDPDQAQVLLEALFERTRGSGGGMRGIALHAARELVALHTTSGRDGPAGVWETRVLQLAGE